MHFSTLVATAFLPLLHLASAGCYTSGASWPSDHAAMLTAIQSASFEMELDSPLPTGEHKYLYQAGDKCIKFILDNISGGSRSISTSEASDGFTKEYRGCDHGGDTSYTNWRYVVDPNQDLSVCNP